MRAAGVNVCVVPTYAQRRCVSMCWCVQLHKAQNGSQWTGIFRTGPCGWREKRERDDDEGWWRLADGVQQGWSSLLMNGHLRPPFTLNVGHCSCPDLGFDPQRCLTPTIPPELPPCHLDSTHAYVYICAHTHTYICMYTYADPYTHVHPSTGTSSGESVFGLDTCTQTLHASHKSLSLSAVTTKEREGIQGTG